MTHDVEKARVISAGPENFGMRRWHAACLAGWAMKGTPEMVQKLLHSIIGE